MGYSKGLVDAVSTFGVKSTLTRAVITQNLDYGCAKDIFEYLNGHFKDDASKLYSVLSAEEISKFVIDESPLSINSCMKLHMISYFPNRSIQSKVNICSCDSCIEGEFTSCLIEKGKIVQIVDEANDHDDDDSSESEFENDLESGDESDTEAYELRAESVNSVLRRNNHCSLFCFLFFGIVLCKVLDFGIADENMAGDYNHLIPKGSKYKKCQYYQKQKES